MHKNRPKPGAGAGTEAQEEVADQLKPHKPPGGEPVEDEEMFVDPLTLQIDSGGEAEKPPSGA